METYLTDRSQLHVTPKTIFTQKASYIRILEQRVGLMLILQKC